MNQQQLAHTFLRSIKANLPYVIKQEQTSDNKIRIQNISDYYQQQVIGKTFIIDVFCIGNDMYFNFNLPFVIPLRQILQKLQRESTLNEKQITVVNKIIEKIIFQTSELFTKRSLCHNQISLKNILIISVFDHIYTWDRLESFDIKFVNFANFLSISKDQAYKNDINSLKDVLSSLFELINKNIDFSSFNNHIDFSNLIMPNNNFSKSIVLFEPRKCTNQQEQQLNEIFNQNIIDEFIQKPIQLLRSILLQQIYKIGFEIDLFQQFLDEFKNIEVQISSLQQEFQNLYCSLIEEAEQSLIRNFKFSIKEEIQQHSKQLLAIFGESLFIDFFQYSQFNLCLKSLEFFRQRAEEIFLQSKNQISQQIKKIVAIIVDSKFCQLIEALI